MLLVKIAKAIEWLTFIGLCISSIMFTHEVWEHYASYDSSYKISVGHTSESPTFIICFSPRNSIAFEYGRDFNISYIIDMDLKNLQTLKEGINIIETSGTFINGTKTKINYEILHTIYNGICHKISSDLISYNIWAAIVINFSKEVPEEVNYIISSGNNSYGQIMAEYYEGSTHNGFGLFGQEIWMKLQSRKYIYLDESVSPKSKCKNGFNFYECYEDKILQEIGNDCPSKCFPASNIKVASCKTIKEKKCAMNVISKNYSFIHSLADRCPRSCTSIGFINKYKWVGNFVERYFGLSNQSHAFWFWYKTEKGEEQHIEYLVYDFNSMLGSIGGALGMFIGFSFSNVISLALNKLHNGLSSYAFQDHI